MGCAFGRPQTAGDPDGAGDVSRKDREDAKSAAEEAPSYRGKVALSLAPKDPFGWPTWLDAAAGDALRGWAPRRADSFQKLDKIGQGTYNNVYKARDLVTGKVVALKKVRFDITELESVRFMAREISVLRRLDHPNIVKLEGLVTSRVSHSMYLIFEYMEHDLAGLAAFPGIQYTEPQVKCYVKQLLSGLEHCHTRGVLHRDIKGSNLLLDNEGILKIADFGLASTFGADQKQPLTSRAVTLWYRTPELLLGSTYYGVGVDLWSAGCILAELLAGKPILPATTERRKILANVNVTNKSEKFPPHQDGAVGFTTASFAARDASLAASLFESKLDSSRALADLVQNGRNVTARRKRTSKEESQATVSENFSKPLKSSSFGLLMDLRRNTRNHRKTKGKEWEVFGAGMKQSTYNLHRVLL